VGICILYIFRYACIHCFGSMECLSTWWTDNLVLLHLLSQSLKFWCYIKIHILLLSNSNLAITANDLKFRFLCLFDTIEQLIRQIWEYFPTLTLFSFCRSIIY
jgi:hypothetical protein